MKAGALMPVNVNGGAVLSQADYHTSTHPHDWSFHHPSAVVCGCLAKSIPPNVPSSGRFHIQRHSWQRPRMAPKPSLGAADCWDSHLLKKKKRKKIIIR